MASIESGIWGALLADAVATAGIRGAVLEAPGEYDRPPRPRANQGRAELPFIWLFPDVDVEADIGREINGSMFPATLGAAFDIAFKVATHGDTDIEQQGDAYYSALVRCVMARMKPGGTVPPGVQDIRVASKAPPSFEADDVAVQRVRFEVDYLTSMYDPDAIDAA